MSGKIHYVLKKGSLLTEKKFTCSSEKKFTSFRKKVQKKIHLMKKVQFIFRLKVHMRCVTRFTQLTETVQKIPV